MLKAGASPSRMPSPAKSASARPPPISKKDMGGGMPHQGVDPSMIRSPNPMMNLMHSIFHSKGMTGQPAPTQPELHIKVQPGEMSFKHKLKPIMGVRGNSP